MVAKVWAILLSFSLATACVFAVVNFFLLGFKVELFIGLAMSLVLISLIGEPVAAMFFHAEMTRYKKRSKGKTVFDRIGKAVCGERMIFTPKHFYIILWSLLFIVTVSNSSAGTSVFAHRWLPSITWSWR